MRLQQDSLSHTTCLLGKYLPGSMKLFSGKMFRVLVHLQPETFWNSKAALNLGKIQAGHCKLCIILWPWTRKITSILRSFCPMEMVGIVLGFIFYCHLLTSFLSQILKKASSISPACFCSLEGSVRVLLSSCFLKDALRTCTSLALPASACAALPAPYHSPSPTSVCLFPTLWNATSVALAQIC